ncbi:MAG: hypothetical protein R3B90_23395 [Planctomycetaceae bacterium]
MKFNPVVKKLVLEEQDSKLFAAIRIGKDEGMQVFNDSLYSFITRDLIDRASAFEISPEHRGTENDAQRDRDQPRRFCSNHISRSMAGVNGVRMPFAGSPEPVTLARLSSAQDSFVAPHSFAPPTLPMIHMTVWNHPASRVQLCTVLLAIWLGAASARQDSVPARLARRRWRPPGGGTGGSGRWAVARSSARRGSF